MENGPKLRCRPGQSAVRSQSVKRFRAGRAAANMKGERMSQHTNQVVRLKRRPPPGLPGADTWSIAEEAVRNPAAGEILVRVRFISIDPPMRHWITDVKAGHFQPVAVGDVMRTGESIGQIVDTEAMGFAAGDLVVGSFGVQQFWTGAPHAGIRKLDPGPHPVERYLGVLGLSGLTSYFGILDIGQVKPGETVLVSSAAGVVGALAGQIARLRGCRVIGIAGGPTKCRYVTEELGFNACIDYKLGEILPTVRHLAPDGIDVFFDNVGGAILEAALSVLRFHARIVLSGAIGDYNDIESARGPRNYLNLRQFRSRMEGFVVLDYAERFASARADISNWLVEGTVKAREHVEVGLERFPEVMPMLFTGANFGKLILQA